MDLDEIDSALARWIPGQRAPRLATGWRPWSPTRDIRDAWDLVEHLGAEGWSFHVSRTERAEYVAFFVKPGDTLLMKGAAPEAPLAISRAALATRAGPPLTGVP